MSALPSNVVDFKLPKRPKIREKEPLPDQRKVAVLPIRALTDKDITDGSFRALAMLCSYCNRAGVTWVSQTKLAKDMGVTQQAISKHITKLQKLGYVELIKKGFRGERSSTWRVVFDKTVDLDTAIAITSSIEDTRTPAMRQEQQEQIDNTINHEGLKRIQDMIKGTLKPMNQPAKEYQMPKGDTATVAKMKADIAAHKQRKAVPTKQAKANPYTTSEVVHGEPLHTQPESTISTTPEVVQNTKNTLHKDYLKVFVKYNVKDNKEQVILRLEDIHNLTLEQLDADVAMLLKLYQSEGLPAPDCQSIVDSVVQLHRDSPKD